jgi:hypothetical protein
MVMRLPKNLLAITRWNKRSIQWRGISFTTLDIPTVDIFLLEGSEQVVFLLLL